jgi:preprotein translocase subunit SecD
MSRLDVHLTSRASALKPARSREARVKPSLASLLIAIVLSLGVAGCGASGPQRSVSSPPRQAGTSVRLVYRAQGGTEPVASRSLTAAIAIMRRRVEALGVSHASIRRVGTDEVEAVLPAGSSAAAQEAVSKTGQLYFYAWEPNVIGAGGRPAPSDGAATGDEAVEGPGGRSAGLPEYRAVPAQGKEEFTGWPDITFGFTPHGAAVFERVTKEIAHRGLEAQLPGVTKEEAEQHFAVVLDGQLLTVPSIDYGAFPEGIDASKGSEISGGFTRSSAQALTSELKSGPLPIGLELIPRG